MVDFDSTQTSRSRMLHAGKMLFARNGYEQTSTAAIAREAATSESQLVRYFGGKAGLLEAIFNESWAPLNDRVRAGLPNAPNAKAAIEVILASLIEVFGKDHDLAFLFLFEGRRVRSSRSEILLSKGFVDFYSTICRLVEKGQQDGSIRKDLHRIAIASAVMGAAEGMIRDLFVAERSSQPRPFSDEAIQQVFSALLGAL
jgi:AcrR family transcriptional regulator